MHTRIRAVYRKIRTLRFGRYAAIGTVTTGVNILLLSLLVDIAGLNPSQAYLSRTLGTAPVEFEVQRRYVWPEANAAGWRAWLRRFVRFSGSKFGFAIMGQPLFALLVALGVHHAIAYLATVTGIGTLKYYVLDKFVFPMMRRVRA